MSHQTNYQDLVDIIRTQNEEIKLMKDDLNTIMTFINNSVRHSASANTTLNSMPFFITPSGVYLFIFKLNKNQQTNIFSLLFKYMTDVASINTPDSFGKRYIRSDGKEDGETTAESELRQHQNATRKEHNGMLNLIS